MLIFHSRYASSPMLRSWRAIALSPSKMTDGKVRLAALRCSVNTTVSSGSWNTFKKVLMSYRRASVRYVVTCRAGGLSLKTNHTRGGGMVGKKGQSLGKFGVYALS